MASGLASAELVNAMEILQRAVLERRQRLPVPSSFLLDGRGHLAVIYRGPVSRDQLEEDVALLGASPHQRRQTAVPFPGRWTSKPLPPDPRPVLATFVKAGQLDQAAAYAKRCLADSSMAEDYETDIRRLLGDIYLDQRKTPEAISMYARLLALAPEEASSHREIGQQLIQRQQPKAAIAHLIQAARIQTNDLELRLNLAFLLIRERRHEEAIPHLQAVIHARPAVASLRWELAKALENTGRLEQSIEQYEQVMKILPDHREAAASLARLRHTLQNRAK